MIFITPKNEGTVGSHGILFSFHPPHGFTPIFFLPLFGRLLFFLLCRLHLCQGIGRGSLRCRGCLGWLVGLEGWKFVILLMVQKSGQPVEVGSLSISHDLQGFSTIPGGARFQPSTVFLLVTFLYIFSSWWLNQPISKICSSKWVHLAQGSG